MSRGNQSISTEPKTQYILYKSLSENGECIWGVYDTLPALRAALGKTYKPWKYYVRKVEVSTKSIEFTQEDFDYIHKAAIDKDREIEYI